MKALKLLMVFIILIAGISFASAAFQTSEQLLGGPDQERGQTVTATYIISNNGPLDINNVHVTASGISTAYKLITTLLDSSVSTNGSLSLVVTAYVPLSLNAVDSRGNELQVSIGNLIISGEYSDGTNVPAYTIPLKMQAENKLSFRSNKIIIDGSSKTLKNDDYKVDRNADIEISSKVENTFSDEGDCDTDGTNCDIEDITVRIESTDSDLDVDEEMDFGYISANDDDTDSVSFYVPDDIDDGTYGMEMWLTGVDENGARHGERLKFYLRVEVPNDEVLIKNFDLIPGTLSCNDRSATLTVTLENTGSDDQDRASLFIESTKLDIKQSVYNILLDSGDTVSKTFEIDVPDDISPGTYFIQMIANVQINKETDRQAAQLVVRDCQPSTGGNGQTDGQTGGQATGGTGSGISVITIPPTGGVIYSTPKKQSFFDTTEYILLLAMLFFIALVLLLILIVVMVRK
jgi:hypothetical protein